VDHGQLKHAMEVHGQFLESRTDAPQLLEPTDALLSHAASAIGPLIKPDRRIVPGVLVLLVWDHRLDLLLGQPVADPLYAIPFVSGQLPGFMSASAGLPPSSDQQRDRLPDDRLGPRRLVDLARGDFDGKGSALTVSDHVEFRSKSAFAAAQCVVGGFVGVPLETFLSAPAAARAARTDEPSTHHSSQSMYPLLSSFTCKASMMTAKTPLLRQLRKWSYTVCQGPKRSGRSRQGAPVERIQKTPFRSVRRSRAGRPVRAVLGGKCGSTNAHCSSERSWRFIDGDLHVVQIIYSLIEFSDRA
jgi:hypothetical protein